MIDDLARYGPDAQMEADVCIVGSGAAGIALARRLGSTGAQVLLLESGGLEAEESTDDLKRGEGDGIDRDMFDEGRARVFGGTTTLWAGQCIPLDPIDFERREWVPHSGWPIGPEALEPYYQPAAELFDVPGEGHDESLWGRWGDTPPALDPDRLVHSYTAWSPKPDLGKAYRQELEAAPNIRVLLHANVVGLRTGGDDGRMESVRVRATTGQAATIAARCCVLCAGGVENARLLLVADREAPGRLGPAADAIGRYFQDHPNAHTATIATDRPGALQEPYSLFYRRGTRYLPKLKLAPAVQRREEVLNCAANLDYEFQDAGLNALRDAYRRVKRRSRPSLSAREWRLVAGSVPEIGATAYRRYVHGRSSRATPARIRLQVHSEQTPDPHSRVVLADELDSLGVPRARVQWRLSDQQLRTFTTITATVADELERLGLGTAQPDAWLEEADGGWRSAVGDSYHHIGSTRMSATPADGVVDTDCRVHGVPGLYVAGSSVFPTSGFANPTLAITALALRLGDHLERSLQPGTAGPA